MDEKDTHLCLIRILRRMHDLRDMDNMSVYELESAILRRIDLSRDQQRRLARTIKMHEATIRGLRQVDLIDLLSLNVRTEGEDNEEEIRTQGEDSDSEVEFSG